MANPNGPTSVRPNKKIAQPVGTPAGTRGPTPGTSDSMSKAASKNMEPGQVRPAPQTGKPRQQTQDDTNAPAPDPQPAPNPNKQPKLKVPAPTKPGGARTASEPAPLDIPPEPAKPPHPYHDLIQTLTKAGAKLPADPHLDHVREAVAQLGPHDEVNAAIERLGQWQKQDPKSAARLNATGRLTAPTPQQNPEAGLKGKKVARPAAFATPAPDAPPPRAKAAAGEPDPGPIRPRKEGEEWRGPSGHWFTQENGKPKLDASKATPVLPPRMVNGKPVDPLPDRIKNGQHDLLTADEYHAAAKALIGNSGRLRVNLPPVSKLAGAWSALSGGNKRATKGDTFDITDGQTLHQFLQKGGKLSDEHLAKLEPLRSSTRRLNGPPRPNMNRATPPSPVDLIGRREFDKVKPEDFEEAARQMMGQAGVTQVFIKNRGYINVRSGADLEKALRAGGKLTKVQRRDLEPLHHKFHAELADQARAAEADRAAQAARATADDGTGLPYDRADGKKPTATTPFVNPASPNVPGTALSPEHAEVAAQALMKGNPSVRMYDQTGRPHDITDGPSLQHYLASGGGLNYPEHRDAVRGAIHDHMASQAQPVSPKAVAEAAKTGQPIPPEEFAPAASAVPVSKPEHVSVLRDVHKWAQTEALPHVDKLVQHLKVTPEQAHDMLTNAMIALAGHAAKKPLGQPATASTIVGGGRLTLPQNEQARAMVRHMSEHITGGHDVTHAQVADFLDALRTQSPDYVGRVAHTLKSALTKEQRSDVDDIIEHARDRVRRPTTEGGM